MGSEYYYRILFLFAAAWNWVISALFFFFYGKIFSSLNMRPLNYPATLKLFMCLVFVFGLGYYWAYKDANKNIPVIKMGAIGKTFIFMILFYYCFITKGIPVILVIPGVVDLIFAILFVEFLIHANPHRQI